MKKYISISIILLNIYSCASVAQNQLPIKFGFRYASNSDSDKIKLIVENISDRTLYYSIGVQALIDTGWVSLISDINSLGQNDFLAFKPINRKSQIIKHVSKREILYIYDYREPKKIRFDVMYREKQNFDIPSEIIYSLPIIVR